MLAVCGKGGVGKTALSALLARVLLEAGCRPLLLIDADPAGGLSQAIGERITKSLGSVRDALIRTARLGDDAERTRIAAELDYMVLEALVERSDYSLLAMGRSAEPGCYCPVNRLLREAIDLVCSPFALVLVDAEPGLEQINRQVTRRVSRVLAVTDGSQRGAETMRQIAELVGAAAVSAVLNRATGGETAPLPAGVALAGSIPEDDALRQLDRQGLPLWGLPAGNAALRAVERLARALDLHRVGASAVPT
jgi:CO dehydrogenase maturation factor